MLFSLAIKVISTIVQREQEEIHTHSYFIIVMADSTEIVACAVLDLIHKRCISIASCIYIVKMGKNHMFHNYI